MMNVNMVEQPKDENHLNGLNTSREARRSDGPLLLCNTNPGAN